MAKRDTDPNRPDAHREPLLARAAGDAPAERRCLTCGTSFPSEGWHNRLCPRCAKRSQSVGTYAARGVSPRPSGRGGQS